VSCRRRAAALIALLLSAPVAAAQHRLTTLPLDDPAYTQLEALERQGCAEARLSPYRPYLVGWIRQGLEAARGAPHCGGPLYDALAARFITDTAVSIDTAHSRFRVGAMASLRGTAHHGEEFRPLWRDVRSASDSGDPAVLGLARLRFSWSDGPKFLAVVEGYGETNVRNDPTVRAEPFRHGSGVIDVSDTYLNGQLGPVWLSLGRSREAWLGEGTESLMLSANGPAYDRIAVEARWKHWEIRVLASSIDDVLLDPSVDTGLVTQQERWHRYLFAHGLTYRPSQKVELTIGETALLPLSGSGFNMAYLNALVPYQITQHDAGHTGGSGGDPNLTGFFAVRATLGRFALHGEWLIDDLQIDSQDRKIYPDLFGWYADASYAIPVSLPLAVGLQYKRTSSYTYLKEFYTGVYQQYNQPIGSELGPDADLIRGYGELWTMGKLRLTGGIGHWRHGAQRIDQRPPHDRQGHAGEPFPSTDAERPAVQGAFLGDATVQWNDTRFPITLRVEGAHMENTGNQPGVTANLLRAQLEASFRFRYP